MKKIEVKKITDNVSEAKFSVYNNIIECTIYYYHNSQDTTINVYDRKTGSKYVPWYCQGLLGYAGKNRVVKIINKNIEKKLKELDWMGGG